MDIRPLTNKDKSAYNRLVTHVIQSWEWGEFRKSLGLPLLRYGIFEKNKLVTAFQLTLHKIPFTNYFVGYLPKGPFPDKKLAQALEKIGRDHQCAFIKLEPDSITDHSLYKVDPHFQPSPKPLFTKYNFVLDITMSEEELLKQMDQKTRYNIRVAQKHGVVVEERTDDEALETYLKLYFDTTSRQNYQGHTKTYHRKVWNTLKEAGMARLLIAYYDPNNDPAGTENNDKSIKERIPLTAWMLLDFQDTLYYPYGGSSVEYRKVMSNNLVAWEAIKLGKKLKLKKFDMWGALGPKADQNDPWMGFHRFKQGYGGELVEYLGTYDLIFNFLLYKAFTYIDKATSLKLLLLRILGK